MTGGPSSRRVLVVCIGNSLVADDAVGCRIYERLGERALPEEVRLECLGVGGMSLLEEIQGEDALVVVDAVQFGRPAGTIHVLAWENLPAAAGPAVSVHGIGVREALDVARILYPERMPGRVVLVGVEGRCFDEIGPDMTAEVASAIPGAVDEVLRQVASTLAG